MRINRLFLLIPVIFPVFLFSQFSPMGIPQSSIVFSYDDAGNQVYRGIDSGNQQVKSVQEEPQQEQNTMTDEERFWLGIQIYPVPVKDVLTISWNEENDALIDHVSLYQHTTLAHLFQKRNTANLNKQIQIEMLSYYMGVYVLTFQLKNGKTMSRNITKF